MRKSTTVILFLAAWALSWTASPAFAEARVDWTRGQVEARAFEPVDPDPYAPTGDPAVALRKAALAARKELLEAVAAIRFDADFGVGGLLSRDQALAGRVRGLLQNSPFQGAEGQDADGRRGMAATAEARLSGPLLDLLMPPSLVQFQSAVPPRRTLAPRAAPQPGLTTLAPSPAPAPGLLQVPAAPGGPSANTGLIVDARALPLIPALLPVILDESGTGLYGAFLVARAAALANRLVLYTASVDDPAVRERCGAQPLHVKAVSLGPSNVDPVLSSGDAERVRALMRNPEALARCAVAVLWTPPAAPAVEAAAPTPESNDAPR